MNRLKRVTINALIAASLVGAMIPRGTWAATFVNPVPVTAGTWQSVMVGQDSAGWRIESYKVSRNLLAWAEVNDAATQRKLYAWDNTKTTLLATLDTKDWYIPTGEDSFYDATLSGYDAADGLVVWVQWDGHDREIMGWNGSKTYKVSNNTYDDRHPVTSHGAVAWTSQPVDNGAYNLMWRDASGTRRLDTWQAMNYAISGDRLFWLNRKGNGTFKVYAANKGRDVKAIGDGDDRPLKHYFFTDGRGAVAWEYSTKRWEYDKRVIWHSFDAVGAYAVVQRDVPPAETRLEAVYGRRLAYNIKDWTWQNLLERTMLIEENDMSFSTIWKKAELAKVRYMDSGSVRHRENDGNSSLIFRGNNGGEDFVGLEYVIKDRFDAHGTAAAGARVGTGVVAFADGKTTVIPTTLEVENLAVRDGDIAWIEGKAGNQKLSFATRAVMVASKGTVTATTGFVAKQEGAKKATLWYLTREGGKYAFRNETQYRDWFSDFDSVRTLTKAQLDQYPTLGSVTVKPGVRLVKNGSNPTIYVMGADLKLHWVSSAEVLVNNLGKDWSKKVEVLNNSVFADYAVSGGYISADWEYLSIVNGTAK